MEDLQGILSALRGLPMSEPKDVTIRGHAIQDGQGSYIAIEESGYAMFLIPVGESLSVGLPIKLANLWADFGVSCDIRHPDGEIRTGRYSIICLSSRDSELESYFVTVMRGVIHALPYPLDGERIAAVIRGVVELFRAALKAEARSVIGLWAELFVIVSSRQPGMLLSAWHADSHELFDLSLGDQVIEVKASVDRSRRHHFRLAQLWPPEGVRGIVASCLLERATNGLTLGELWDRARELARFDVDLLLRVDANCLDQLGTAWNVARNAAFSEHRARSSLRFFSMGDIPRISEHVPMGISDVEFMSNLELSEPIEVEMLREAGGMFSSL